MTVYALKFFLLCYFSKTYSVSFLSVRTRQSSGSYPLKYLHFLTSSHVFFSRSVSSVSFTYPMKTTASNRLLNCFIDVLPVNKKSSHYLWKNGSILSPRAQCFLTPPPPPPETAALLSKSRKTLHRPVRFSGFKSVRILYF